MTPFLCNYILNLVTQRGGFKFEKQSLNYFICEKRTQCSLILKREQSSEEQSLWSGIWTMEKLWKRIWVVWEDEVEPYGWLLTELINKFLKMKQESSGYRDWRKTEVDNDRCIADYFRKHLPNVLLLKLPYNRHLLLARCEIGSTRVDRSPISSPEAGQNF